MEQTFKTTTLTREEIVALHQEIGYVTEQGTYPGLLTEELNETVKYWLRRLNTFLAKETKSLEKERIELCEKFGTLNKDANKYDFEGENETNFKDDYKTLCNIEVPVKHAIFKFEDFNFTSKRNYETFDKIKEAPEGSEETVTVPPVKLKKTK